MKFLRQFCGKRIAQKLAKFNQNLVTKYLGCTRVLLQLLVKPIAQNGEVSPKFANAVRRDHFQIPRRHRRAMNYCLPRYIPTYVAFQKLFFAEQKVGKAKML
jgi:hypothetical protein